MSESATEIQMGLFDLAPELAPEPAAEVVGLAGPPPGFDPEQIPLDAKVPIPPGTYGAIEPLIAHCQACVRCELSQSRTHVVIERGNRQAKIAIIGEGPGQTEDETGLPFVGKSGQLLDKILESVRLSVERDVYICNVVRCRPPDNRTPTPEEMAACKPYLLEQLRLVDPKIILLTGATAVKALLGRKEGITKLRGQWLEWEGRACMPILHPAYLLRNASKEKGSPKWLTWQDMQTVRARYDALVAAETGAETSEA